ncbi:MAG: hypothetical protein ACKO0X_00310, partial [Bacteroidota bacterium]
MKNRLIISLYVWLSCSVVAIGQDYALCNQYTEIGDFAKARQCLYAYKGVNDPGALCFYKMNLAINEGDVDAAKSLYAESEKLTATDPFVLGTKAVYIAYSNNAEAAKLVF